MQTLLAKNAEVLVIMAIGQCSLNLNDGASIATPQSPWHNPLSGRQHSALTRAALAAECI